MPPPPEVPAGSLISQPGSDYQLTEITPHLGRARDITRLLTDIHGLLSELCLDIDHVQPQITALVQDSLRNCDSPDTLVGAVDQVITQLTRATRSSTSRPPPASPARSHSDQPSSSDGHTGTGSFAARAQGTNAPGHASDQWQIVALSAPEVT
jgi:hypothetical protein